jgi:hypothetical protein
VVALLEVVINRVAIGSRTEPGLTWLWLLPGQEVPTWHWLLSTAGLFLFYFSGTLAAILVAVRCIARLRRPSDLREMVSHVALAVAGLTAAVPLVVEANPGMGLPLEITFAVAVIALVVNGFGRDRDLGVQIGLIVIAVPLLVHTVSVFGGRYLWPEGVFDTPGVAIAHAGVLALCVAGLISPYVFAPRPFSRAVTRPIPVVIAMTVAAVGALFARMYYPTVTKAAELAIGVEVTQGARDPRLALYLLAIATLAWTLVSCALAASPARRTIGAGIALVLLGGYAFKWPSHYLLPLLGMSLISDAARRVREEELAALPIAIETPPVADVSWQAYVVAVTNGLKRSLGDVHALTTRGDGGLTSSLIIGDKDGMAVRTRIERIEGSVVALDVTLGREVDELRGATLCMWAIPPRQLGVNPAGPPAAPLFKSGDAAFDQRFRSRGSALAFSKLFDEGLRARAVATLDGWLAYWEPEGVRYRVYPGRGAPLDHPMPLSDLALERPGNPERLVAVVELLVEIATRGVKVEQPAAPTQLEPVEPIEENPA